MRIVRVGEKIVSFGRPSSVASLVIQGLHVAAGCRVEQMHAGLQLIRIANHLVHVLKVHISCVLNQVTRENCKIALK